jgi:hypothetical protein
MVTSSTPTSSVSELVRNFHLAFCYIFHTQRVITNKNKMKIVNSVTQPAEFTQVFSSFKISYVFTIEAKSGFAIAERSELTKHHDISNNIDSACAFRVAGTAKSDL